MLHTATGVRRHAARAAASVAAPARSAWWISTRALSRVHDELVTAARREPIDLVIGGSIGGLGVAADIGRAAQIPFAVDLEDFHPAESVAPDAELYHGLATTVLTKVFARAAFVTTSSECIAARYHSQFGVKPAVIHNVFPLPAGEPRLDRDPGPLRLYWFSQTIGPNRGIEHMIEAVRVAGIPAQITLRGNDTGFVADARLRAATVPNLTLRVEPPADPDSMVALCAGHDIGFSIELEPIENRKLCLTNKVFTYLVAGLPAVMNDTPAQKHLGAQLDDAAFVYPSHDVGPLAEWLRAMAAEPERLAACRRAAWQAALRRWHWEHEAEEGQLLSLVRRTLA